MRELEQFYKIMNNNYLEEPSKSRKRSGKNKGESSGMSVEDKKRKFHDQKAFLEQEFQKDDKLNPERRAELASLLKVNPIFIDTWFMQRGKNNNLKEENARLKEENKRLKMENNKLRSLLSNNNPNSLNATDSVLVENTFAKDLIREFIPSL